MSKRTIKKYDKEFKQNAVNLCLNNDRHYREIAKDLGIAPSTLGSWIEASKKKWSRSFSRERISKTIRYRSCSTT